MVGDEFCSGLGLGTVGHFVYECRQPRTVRQEPEAVTHWLRL